MSKNIWYACQLAIWFTMLYCAHIRKYIFYEMTNIFQLYRAKMDGLMMQTYLHHSLGIIGAILGLYLGGFFGSIS